MNYIRSTFKQLTAPGYFDYSGQQTPTTLKFNNWFNNIMTVIQNNVNLMDSIFRLWASRDYSLTTIPITPWIRYLLNQNGIGWYSQNLSIAISLLIYISKSYPKNAVLCFQQLFEFLFSLGWITGTGQILFSNAKPARFTETFLIYSTAGSPPPAPIPSTYIPLEWTAPSGWSLTASNATYYSRGYISSTVIIWMTPQPTNVVYMMIDVSDIASLPISASQGQLAGVYDDGTGDISSVYYFDGSGWVKTTGKNSDQGLVVGQMPPDPGSSVFAPLSGVFSSGLQPPVSGPSQGYGYYGIYGQLVLESKKIDIIINLTDAGFLNLGLIIFLFRKIKPTLNALFLNYNTPEDSTLISVEITDSGATE